MDRFSLVRSPHPWHFIFINWCGCFNITPPRNVIQCYALHHIISAWWRFQCVCGDGGGHVRILLGYIDLFFPGGISILDVVITYLLGTEERPGHHVKLHEYCSTDVNRMVQRHLHVRRIFSFSPSDSLYSCSVLAFSPFIRGDLIFPDFLFSF